MSDINLDFTVSNNNIGFTVEPNDITITPTDIQLSFYNAPRPSAGGNITELQYNLAGDLAGIPTATYSSNILNLSNANISNSNLTNISNLTTSGNVNIGTTGNVIINNASLTNVASFNASSLIKIKAGTELVTLTTTPTTGTINYDLIDQAIVYNTANLTGNLTLNFRGNGSTTLDSIISTGNSIVGTYITSTSAAVYTIANINIDNTSQIIKWVNSFPPTGNGYSTTAFTFTIIKRAANTYTVLGSSTRYG